MKEVVRESDSKEKVSLCQIGAQQCYSCVYMRFSDGNSNFVYHRHKLTVDRSFKWLQEDTSVLNGKSPRSKGCSTYLAALY
jgi:hypothetical protein